MEINQICEQIQVHDTQKLTNKKRARTEKLETLDEEGYINKKKKDANGIAQLIRIQKNKINSNYQKEKKQLKDEIELDEDLDIDKEKNNKKVKNKKGRKKKAINEKKNNNNIINENQINIINNDLKDSNYLKLSIVNNENDFFGKLEYIPKLEKVDLSHNIQNDKDIKEYISYVYNPDDNATTEFFQLAYNITMKYYRDIINSRNEKNKNM